MMQRRKIRVEFGEHLAKTYYKKPVLWNSSYLIASCGGVTISALKKYIEHQNTPEMGNKDPVQNSSHAHASL